MERPEWLVAILPPNLPEVAPTEETCFGVPPSIFRALGMRPRHHWDGSPRIDHGKHFCLRCAKKRCQVTKADPRSGSRKTAGWQCERASRHRGKHQRYKGNGKVDRSW